MSDKDYSNGYDDCMDEVSVRSTEAALDDEARRARANGLMLFTATILASLALLGVAVLGFLDRRAACDTAVRTRDAQRYMWVWLTDELIPTGNELAIQGRDRLELGLPQLHCPGLGISPTPMPVDLTVTPTTLPG